MHSRSSDTLTADAADRSSNPLRLSVEQIEPVIIHEQYVTFPGTTVTVCCLTLANGHTVTGESVAASPEYFDEAIGKAEARRVARDKIWSLEVYVRRQRLHEAALPSLG